MASWRRQLPVLVTSLVAAAVLIVLSRRDFTWGRAAALAALYAVTLASWEAIDRRRA